MDKNKITDAFFSRYTVATNDTDALPATQDAPTLQALLNSLIQLVDPLPLPELDAEQRTDMAGKRFPEMQELMFECHEGLQQMPEIAKAIGASPTFFIDVAQQDMSLGGFIKGLQGVAECADTGLLVSAARAENLCVATVDHLASEVANTSPLSVPARLGLNNVFAEALRVRQDALAASPNPIDLRTEAVQLADVEAQAEERNKVHALLQDIGNGEALALSRSLTMGKNKE